MGSNNVVKIGEKCNMNHCMLYIEDDNGKIEIGKHLSVVGECHIDIIEGRSVRIGDDCLFSSEIYFRVGDSHSIIDKSTNVRINPSQDIVVGSHVWIGHDVKILKGTQVPDNCVVATGAIVTGKHGFPRNCIIGGTPAKVLRENINWCAERINY